MGVILNSTNGFFGALGGGTSPSIDTRSVSTSCIALFIATANDPSAWFSDSAGNVWIGPFAHSGGSDLWVYLTAGNVRTSLTHTFSVVQAGQPITFVAVTLGGCNSPLDQQHTGVGTGGTTLQPGPITPSAEGSFMLSAVTVGNLATTFAIDSGFGVVASHDFASGISFGLAVAGLQTPLGRPTKNPTWTFGSSVASSYAGILDLIPLANITPTPPILPKTRPAGPTSSGYGYSPLLFGNISTGSFHISGNCGAPGALVMYTGPSSGATTADGSGNYSTPGLPPGNYVVTPSLAGWAFAPPSQAVTISGFNVTGINFAATYTGAIFSISGNCGLAGGIIHWTGTASGSTAADPSGNYTIPFLGPGTYTVTPSATGYTFAPVNAVVPVSSANVTGINFVATPVITGHSISGNCAVANATVNWSGGGGSGGVTADSSGNFIIPGFADGSYTITPRISGWSFTPTSRGVTVAGANVTGVNFSAVNLFQLPLERDPNAAPAPGQIIPLTVSPNQTFNVNLSVDGNALTLGMGLRFNTMAGYWVLSIYDQDGNIILDSLPMITGWYPAANILAQYGYLKIGSAFLLNAGTSASDYPGTSDLGTGFQLLWGDTAA
jgi:hypothetical protein